jgi:hypothetical protein
VGIFFAVVFVNLIFDWKTPQARADSDGITGYPSTRAWRRKFVPWSEVMTCEIQTVHNTFGKPVFLLPILKGRNGETLMRLNMMYVKLEDQERIVKYIKAKLPKSQIDPWEL